MPDQVEHHRRVSHDPKPPTGKKGERRVLQAPGTYWEYNDVRINQLSLALLHVFREPLQQVFARSVLEPLGGGRGFRWRDDHRRKLHHPTRIRHRQGEVALLNGVGDDRIQRVQERLHQ